MRKEGKKTDWSNRRLKDLLIKQRRFLWLEDALDKLAAWIGFKIGMTVIDVGCGLGYLGYTYWPYFGNGGCYFGVDISTKLLQDAIKSAKRWAKKGRSYFLAGDVYKLPFPDNFADCTMCQTLLMQIEDPHSALVEMARVTKPNGSVMCKEPDNLSWSGYSSLPEMTLKDQLLVRKCELICKRGRINLGRGDITIGNKLPHMMKEIGLVDIDVRINEKVYYFEPPYSTPMQKYQLTQIKKDFESEKKDRRFWLKRAKEHFLAGGGNIKDFKRVIQISNKRRRLFRKQIKNKEYFECTSGLFYIIRGRKPS